MRGGAHRSAAPGGSLLHRLREAARPLAPRFEPKVRQQRPKRGVRGGAWTRSPAAGARPGPAPALAAPDTTPAGTRRVPRRGVRAWGPCPPSRTPAPQPPAASPGGERAAPAARLSPRGRGVSRSPVGCWRGTVPWGPLAGTGRGPARVCAGVRSVS